MMKIQTFILLLFISSSAQAIELIDKEGAYDAKAVNGKIYNDTGHYTGMITSEGKMYDKEGQFTGQIKGGNILDQNGDIKAYIRDGKIYDKAGHYTGRLKR